METKEPDSTAVPPAGEAGPVPTLPSEPLRAEVCVRLVRTESGWELVSTKIPVSPEDVVVTQRQDGTSALLYERGQRFGENVNRDEMAVLVTELCAYLNRTLSPVSDAAARVSERVSGGAVVTAFLDGRQARVVVLPSLRMAENMLDVEVIYHSGERSQSEMTAPVTLHELRGDHIWQLTVAYDPQGGLRLERTHSSLLTAHETNMALRALLADRSREQLKALAVEILAKAISLPAGA